MLVAIGWYLAAQQLDYSIFKHDVHRSRQNYEHKKAGTSRNSSSSIVYHLVVVVVVEIAAVVTEVVVAAAVVVLVLVVAVALVVVRRPPARSLWHLGTPPKQLQPPTGVCWFDALLLVDRILMDSYALIDSKVYWLIVSNTEGVVTLFATTGNVLARMICA